MLRLIWWMICTGKLVLDYVHVQSDNARARVLYRPCPDVWSSQRQRSSEYLSDIVTARAVQPRSLVPAHHPPLTIVELHQKPRMSTKFGERAIPHTGPHAWNRLPDQLMRSIANAATFKKHLNRLTHFHNSFLTITVSDYLTFVLHSDSVIVIKRISCVRRIVISPMASFITPFNVSLILHLRINRSSSTNLVTPLLLCC